jgi:AraC-like DNA-binding protein
MVRESTIGAGPVADLIAALAGLGVGSESLCRAAGLEPSALEATAARLPARLIVQLFSEAERATGDRFVGLHAGQRLEPRGPLAYLLMASDRVDQGLRRIVPFAGIMIDTLRIHLEVAADGAALTYDLGDPVLEERHVIDYLLMATLRALNRAAGHPLRVREIDVPYGDPGGGDEVPRAFGCPVHFARADCRLMLAATELQAAHRLASPLVADQIERLAAALLSRITPPSSLSERVAEAVRALIATGVRADRATVARHLGMGGRTLGRGLARDGLTFRSVRDGVRREMGAALLANPSLKVEVVALSTGFADVAAFSKAFKRWTGRSATQYRDRA